MVHRAARAGYRLVMDAPALPLVRRLRIAGIALIAGWFLVPGLQSWIPVWVPFLALAGLELHYLVGGLRDRSLPPKRGRSPLASDISELGGAEWLEPALVRIEGQDVWLPIAGKSEDEVLELIEESRERLRRGEPALEPEPVAPAVPRRPRRLLVRLEGLAVLGALAFVLFVLVPDGGWDGLEPDEQARTEALLSAEAGRIAGHAAQVRCDAEGEAVGIVQHADGVAEVGGSRALLTPEICHRLHRLAHQGDEGSFSQTARAIAVLAHEAWHLRGESDEGVTNCFAFQSGVELGRRLGLSEGTAARMMRQQFVDNATFARSAPAYLVPGECRNGGRLDLDPQSNRFP
jgi:hypothetical protein